MSGDRLQLSAIAVDSSDHVVPGARITWTSTDSARATVDANGLVTGGELGLVAISATSGATPGTTVANGGAACVAARMRTISGVSA